MSVCTFTDFGAGRRHRFCLPLARLSWPPMAAATLSQPSLALDAVRLAVQCLPGHGRDGRCRPMKYQAGILHGYFQNIAADFRPESLSAYLENPAKICLCPENPQSIQKNQGSITANLKKHLKKPVFILGSLGSTGPLNVDAERRKMPCAMRAGTVIYSPVFRARC